MTEPRTTPAGWYDDGQGQNRWWDGAAWTDRLASDDVAPDRSPRLDRAEAKAQKKAERDGSRESRNETGKGFAAVRDAQAAFENGEAFFQLRMGTTPLTGPTPVELLGPIEEAGWRLEHVGYVFTANVASEVGIYLFRRAG